MSRLNELKKQYPELNISIFDIMIRMDTSKSYKYLPLMCKIFGKRFNTKQSWTKEDHLEGVLSTQSSLISRGISTDGLTDNQVYAIHNFLDYYNHDTFHSLTEFMEYMEKGQVENTDVTSYKDIDDIRSAVTLAVMKEINKGLEGQVIKEYEDDKWVIVRPLTFSASIKYGASTRWCTTYHKEKRYFEKYWRRGILVYFINKQTGYKFAGYKGIHDDNEMSFWNAEDLRIDYLYVEADDYLFPIVKKIFKSENSNKNLCSDEIQKQVHDECIEPYGVKLLSVSDTEEVAVPTEVGRLVNAVAEFRMQEVLEQEVSAVQHNQVPTMRA